MGHAHIDYGTVLSMALFEFVLCGESSLLGMNYSTRDGVCDAPHSGRGETATKDNTEVSLVPAVLVRTFSPVVLFPCLVSFVC